MKRITDPTFRYIRSTDTDIRKTFARVRKELQREKEQASKVVPIRKKEEGK